MYFIYAIAGVLIVFIYYVTLFYLFIDYVTLMGFNVKYFNFFVPFVNNCFVTYLKLFVFL